MRKSKLTIVAALMAVVLFVTGCGAKFDASGYVKGILDNIYLDDPTTYMKNVEIDKAEAHEEFETWLAAEADFFLDYYTLGEVSDDVYQQILDMYRAIYQKSQYTVKEAVKNEDNYNVEVLIKPIDIMNTSYDGIEAAIDEFLNTADPEEYTDEQVLNDKLASIVIEQITNNISNISYADEKSVIVKVEKDEDGYYGISDDAINNLDTEIIAY